MTRITNADHVLLLLRARLETLQKARSTTTTGARAHTLAADTSNGLKEILGAGAMPEGELESLVISSILSEEFGAALANDPRFQRTIADVLAIIRRDAEAHALLKRAIAQLARPA